MATITTTIRYATNMAELVRNMQQGRDQIETTTASANRMVAALGGEKLIRAAHNAVAAIEQVGGVAKLTRQEQERLLASLDKSIAKMERMGQVVPTAMRTTANELRAATAAAEKKVSALERVDGALGKVGLSIRGLSVAGLGTSLVSLGRQAFDAAGQIVDLSNKTGLSIKAVQQYGYVAAQSGSSLDQYADTIFKLGIALEQGTEKTRKSVTSLGLGYDQIRSLKPEQQFDAIMRAMAGVESVTERNRLGVELMGKSYANVAAAVDDYIELIGQAPAASDAAVKATDAAGDAMVRTWERAKSAAINAIGGIVLVWEDAQKRLSAQGVSTADRMGPFAGSALGLGARAGAFIREQNTFNLPVVGAPSRGGVPSVGGVTPDIMARLAAVPTANTIATAEALQKRLDVLTGNALRAQVRQLAADVAAAGQQGGITAYQYEQLGAQLVKMREQGAVLPRVLDDIRLKHEQAAFAAKVHVLNMRELQQSFKDVPSAALLNTSLSSKVLKFDPKRLPGQTIELGPAPAMSASQQYGQKLADTIVNAAIGGGNIGGALGAQIVSDLGEQLSRKSAGTLTAMFGKTIGGALASSLPGIGALVGPLAGKLFNSIFGTAGRDMVEGFADKMGGFDQLRRTLDSLGDEGERLWKNLTQGVGRNSPDQAKRAIADIEGALARFEQRQRDVQAAFGSLQGAVAAFGGRAPASLRPMIDGLLTINGLTAEQQTLLGNLAQAPGWQLMEDAAGRLGVSLAALGPAFQQAKLSETALQTVRDLDLLEEGGADMNAVLRESSGHIQSLVDTAMNTGSQLPETLKPYIQRLIDLELLVDPAGELVRNIDQLSFADIKDDALEAIKGILEQIRDLLQTQIPNAARTAQSALDSVEVPEPVGAPNPQYNEDGTPRAHRGAMVTAQGIRRFHSGFPRLASDEFPAILQTGEAVLNRSATSVLGAGRIGSWNQGRFGAASGGGDSNVVINVYPTPGMSESQVAEMVYRRLPRRVKAGGL